MLTSLAANRRTKQQNMPIAKAATPSPSPGEKTILRMLGKIPGVVEATQSESRSHQDMAGIDILVITSQKTFPKGDRKVRIQIKSPNRPEDVAKFMQDHQKQKIAVIQALYCNEYLYEYLYACLIFVLERPVKTILEQLTDEDYIEAFKDKMTILHLHWAEGKISKYRYLGLNDFLVIIGNTEVRLNWKSENFLQKLDEAEREYRI